MGSVNSVDGERAAAAAAAAASATAVEGNHGSTPQPPPRPPPRPQRQSMRPQQLAALVPSPSPEAEAEAADDSSTLLGEDDDLDIVTPVTPKQGRGQTTLLGQKITSLWSPVSFLHRLLTLSSSILIRKPELHIIT